MTFVTVDHVTFCYPNQPAPVIRDISFKISEGGRVALLGESGSGKSTLLRLIAGIETPTSGRVLYNDIPLNETDPMRRNIGMVFQNYALIPHWEAKRTIGFFLALRRREREVPERVRRVAAITGVGLEKLLERTPNHLSGGEKQQVAIARAFARDLSLLLLDEPFANLDAKLRAAARLELQKLLQEFPITTVLVTHDQAEAAAIGGNIILLNNGCIEQAGDYDTLRNDPINLFVAQFIGSSAINRFEGVVRAGQWTHPLWPPVTLPEPLPEGTPLTLCIRPEHVHLDAAGVGGRIIQAQYLYGVRRQLLEVETNGLEWRIECDQQTLHHTGETIHARFDPAGVLFFTPDGERFP
ncbi:MAG: ABC transporter ATP-binding protein [Anaerolineae bacterium]